jgi:hypothetical protein
MSQIIHRGSPEHDAHLIGVERDRLIAENQDRINELVVKRNELRYAAFRALPPTEAFVPLPEDSKAISDLTKEISELENPVIPRDVLNESRQADYKVGFEIGRNRQQLNQGASDQKQAGYAAGMSSGPGGLATSPQTAFSKSESELAFDKLVANEAAEENKTTKVPQRKI